MGQRRRNRRMKISAEARRSRELKGPAPCRLYVWLFLTNPGPP